MLSLIALGVRLPEHQTIPAFTDEVEEFYLGLQAARGQALPLTGVSSYLGSLWNWLVATAFLVSGFSLYAPRALVLALGVLTVPPAYLLGRAWGGRLAGVVTAALLAAAPTHIVVSSRIGYSNSLTPLFTTLGLWLVHRAVGQSTARPRQFALAGLCWGLAFQTHPTVVVLLLGVAIYLIWRHRSLLWSGWSLLGAGLFVLVNANLVIYNLTSGFGSMAVGLQRSTEYSRGEDLTIAVYLGRFGRLLLGLLQNLGGAVDYRAADRDFLLDWGLWSISLLGLIAVIARWRRGEPLAGLLLLSTTLVLPIFSRRYDPVINGRYLAPLLPIVFAALGAEASLLVSRRSPLRYQGLRRAALGVGLAAIGLFLLQHPLSYLPVYYRQVRDDLGFTNARFFAIVNQIVARREPDAPVVLDRPLQENVFGPGVGRIASGFRLAFELSGVPYRFANLSTPELLEPGLRCRDTLVVMAARRPEASRQIIETLGLHSLDGSPGRVTPQSSLFGLYMLDRLPEAPPTC